MPFTDIIKFTDIFLFDYFYIVDMTSSLKNDPRKVLQIDQWCDENFGDRIWANCRNKNGMIPVKNNKGRWDAFANKYCFIDKNDAIVFKLRWLNN